MGWVPIIVSQATAGTTTAMKGDGIFLINQTAEPREAPVAKLSPPKKRREGTIAAVTSQGKTILTPGMATSPSTHLPPKNLLAAIRVMLFNPKTQTKIQLYELNCTNVGTEGTFFSSEDVAKTLVSLELERTTETLPEICCIQSDQVSWQG